MVASRLLSPLSYGCAHYGKSLFWYGSELLFAFYLSEIAGLGAATMGWVVAIGLFVSAAIDVTIGPRMAGSLCTASRAGTLQIRGAAASAAAMVLFFACALLPASLRLPAALMSGLAFRVGYALYDIPQNALLVLCTQEAADRTRLASTRYVFSGLAALTVALCLPLLIADGAMPRAWRYVGAGLMFAALALASVWALAWRLGVGGSRLVAPLPARAVAPMRRDTALLLGLMFLTSLAAPTFTKVEPFFAAFALRDAVAGGAIAASVPVGMVVAQPMWMRAARRLDWGRLIQAAAAAVAVAALLFALVGANRGGAAALAGIVYGAASGGIGMAVWAAFADVVAGAPAGGEARAFGLFTAAAKIALGIGGLGIGAMIAGIDYRGDDSGLLIVAMTVPSVLAGLAIMVAIALMPLSGPARTPGDQR